MRRISKVILDGLTNSMGGTFNHELAKGLAVNEMLDLPVMLDKLLHSTFSDPRLGLLYKGWSRVTPEEAAEEIHRSSKSEGYDVSQSDLYLGRFTFAYGDKFEHTTDKYRWLPYAGKGNMTTLGGSSFVIRPVVSDKSISPGSDTTFLRLLRDKVAIGKLNHACNVNGVRLLDMSVPTLSLYRLKPSGGGCRPTVLFYMLGQYGMTETFKQLGLPTITVIPIEEIGKYSSEEWRVYQTGVMDIRRKEGSLSGTVAFAVPVDDSSPMVDQTMCNVFYLLDNLSASIGMFEHPGEWRRLLGATMYANKPITWLTAHMRGHYDTLLTAYMPPIMVQFIEMDFGDMLDVSRSNDGFFKMLALVFRNYDSWMSLANEISASAYDKRLAVNYFLLYDTIKRVNQISWELMEAMQADRLNENTVLRCLRTGFTLRGMFRMGNSDNISVQSATSHCANYVFHSSTMAALQVNTGGATGAKKAGAGKSGAKSPVDATTLLHETHLLLGTLGAISSPGQLSPLSTLNVYAPIDKRTRTMIPTESDLCHLESLREVLAMMPHRSRSGAIPKLFNRYVVPPKNPPEDW